jgi:hypothetical protein
MSIAVLERNVGFASVNNAAASPGEERMPVNRYNGWLHTHVWQDRLESLIVRYESLDGSADGA